MKNTPIIINNRDRLTSLKGLVTWCREAGFENIIVLDNASTYEPLLDYYRSDRDLQVRFLGKNAGPWALWKPENADLLKVTPFIYSDSDVVPDEDCPKDLIDFLWRTWQACSSFLTSSWAAGGPIQKVGAGLKISDIPDQYSQKAKVVDWETKHFGEDKRQYTFEGVGLYDAAVDTTFALYADSRPFGLAAVRTGDPYLIKHLPWYVDSSNVSDEDAYYEKHSDKKSSNWGANQCYSKTVNRTFKDRKQETPVALTHFTKIPMAIDMAPYHEFYEESVRDCIATTNGQGVTVVEAGVRYGCSARILANVLKDSDNWKLHLIDPVSTKEALEVPKYYPDNVIFHKSPAESAARKFQDHGIDLLHIDADIKGDHPYEMSLQILLAFWNKLKPDGNVILHDCTPHFTTIQRLASELETSGWTAERATPHPDCPISAPCRLKRNPSTRDLNGLTVVLPVINDNYLESLLVGIRNDKSRPDEVIIIDNSGTKAVESVCSAFSDLNVRYLPQKANIGVNASWNLGLKEAKTEIVSILNDDLILPTGFFASIVKVFESMPLAGFVVPQTITNLKQVTIQPGLPLVSTLPAREGWAFTVRKSCVEPVPQSLFTFFGDDWLYDCVQKKGFWCLKVLSNSIYHYVGCSRKPDERKRMGLPDLQQDKSAWQKIQARRLRSAR